MLAAIALAGCGSSAAPSAGAKLVRWTGRERATRVVDLSAPRPDGSVVVATNGHLALLAPDGKLTPFAPSYHASSGLEPYIALSRGCFGAGDVYSLRLSANRGITQIDSGGHVRRFAALPGPGLLNGIAFDQTGAFGHRLLVTSTAAGATSVYAIDCHGHVTTVTRSAPKVEGGLAVAPATFGHYAGDLIAPDEVSGRLYAISPSGHVNLIGQSGVPHGQDIGIESEGFVPRRFSDALVADRLTPGNRHPGDDLILSMPRSRLAAAGVRSGDLLVVTEGGANTIDVRCGATCAVREVATGPPEAHIEGHVEFTRPR